jgi:hypothetical protein
MSVTPSKAPIVTTTPDEEPGRRRRYASGTMPLGASISVDLFGKLEELVQQTKRTRSSLVTEAVEYILEKYCPSEDVDN